MSASKRKTAAKMLMSFWLKKARVSTEESNDETSDNCRVDHGDTDNSVSSDLSESESGNTSADSDPENECELSKPDSARSSR